MKKIRNIKWKKILLLCTLSGVIGLLSVLIINNSVNKSASGKIFTSIETLPQRDVAVVLGTSRFLKNGHENPYFVFRMDAASQLYFTGKVKKILVTGDNSTSSYNEPEQMKNALIDRGLDKKDIVLDYAGFRTFDSMVRAKEVFGLNSFIVVSQAFHCERAIYIANSKGLNVIGFAARDPLSSFKTELREYPARVSAFLDCHILNTKPHFLGAKISTLANI